MKLNNIGYLLKEGFRSIFQHGFMSFAAICVTVACLIIVGSFSALAYNLDIMVQDLNKTSEILVYIDSSLSDAEARSIGTKINLLDNVLEAKFVSREEALQNFVSDHDNDSAFSGVRAGSAPPLCGYPGGQHQDAADRRAALQLPGVDKINAAYELAGGLHHHSERAAHRLRSGDRGAAGGQPADHFQHRQAGHVRPAGRDRHYENGGRHQRLHPAALRGGGLLSGHDRRHPGLRPGVAGLRRDAE